MTTLSQEDDVLVKIPKPWALPDSHASDEAVFLGRRSFLRTAALATAATALPPSLMAAPSLYPARRNEKYELDRPLTEESVAARMNIFDELTLKHDEVWKVAKGFATTPWTIHIGGAVQKHITIDAEELARKLGVEERLYRHRCVEAWSMAVPWTGIPLARLVELAQPLAKAKYLRMVSLASPEKLPGWYASKRVFPYYEALTIAEATNELAMLATGIYGHALPPQHGAPIRLVVPWKYGLKSIKSIVSFQFTTEKPGTFWNDLSPANYTFECNVEPNVPRPWPQTEETVLGTGETRKTLLYNGYAEQVAHLYA